MSLSSLNLDAFLEVARALSFSKAAQALHLTQSALSQRVLNLEEELGLSLFVRQTGKIKLTESGEILLRHCQVRESLETEVRETLHGARPKEVSGKIRIAGFSSVMASVIVPALGDLVRSREKVAIELLVRELEELPDCLRTGAVDYIVWDRELDRPGVTAIYLGTEESVLVEPTRAHRDVYLDHDADDQTTFQFFKLQGKKLARLERFFLDDIQGIVAGVSAGWGRAVVPRHLLSHCKGARVIKTFRPLKTPVYLHYYEQPYYSKLHEAVVDTLSTHCAKILARDCQATI